MLKKLVVACFAAVIVSGMVGVTASAQFTDTPSDAYWSAALDWATQNNVLPDTSGMFKPHEQADRQLAASWMWRMEGSPGKPTRHDYPTTGPNPTQTLPPHNFTDVPSEADHAVRWMVAENITTGTSATTFSPTSGLTRGQLAAFLWRLAGEPSAPPHTFSDVQAAWQQKAVAWLASTGITTGTSATTFSPDAPLTRAHLITFLWRYSNRDAAPQQVSGEICKFSDHSERVRSAVWQVRTGNGIGTAFYIDNDTWLTAAHVVEGKASVSLHNGSDELTATVLGRNRDADMALLSASGAGIPPLAFSDLDSASVGDPLFVVGYPLDIAEQSSVTRGVLSRILNHRSLGTVVVTDASANPGNSGGPLVDECGKVIGMIVAKRVAEDVEGIAYAVSETTLQERIPQIHSGGPDAIAGERTYAECFGSQESEWDSDWREGSGGWDYVVWTHKSDGDVQGGVYLDASSHDLNDYRNTLREGCTFTPWLSLDCTAYESTDPTRMWVWWAGISTGTEDDKPVTIAYRIDGGNRANTAWLAWNDNLVYLGVESAVPLVRQLADAQTFEFWGYDSSGTQVVKAEFELTGVDEALQHLQDTCNWETALPPEVTQPRQPTGPSAWTPFDGENIRGKYVGAFVRVEISEYSWQDNWLRLAVRCQRAAELEVFLVVDGGSFVGSGGPVVQYRFGNQPEITTDYANVGTDNDTAFLNDPHRFVRDLRSDTSGKLFVNLYDWWKYLDDFDLEAREQLNVIGVSQHIEPVAKACGL